MKLKLNNEKQILQTYRIKKLVIEFYLLYDSFRIIRLRILARILMINNLYCRRKMHIWYRVDIKYLMR